MDYFPTILEIAGVAPAAGQIRDGESIVPLLKGTGGLKRDAIYWHYPHYHPGGATPYSAIRDREWKLIEFYEDHRVELYDVEHDIGETRDRAAEMPGKAKQLRERLHGWLRETGAQMPVPNPNYDPANPRKR